MRLVVDASTLVAELLRARGRKLVAHPALEFVVAAETWNETVHELSRRIDRIVQAGHLKRAPATQLLDEALATAVARITLVPQEVYAGQIEQAQRRIPRDIRDAPTVALALTLGCAIWTADEDFFGCGVPVWTTETLQAHLENE